MLTFVGGIGVIAPEPGTTIVGVGAMAIGIAAVPVGTNQMIDGFDQITEGITDTKTDSPHQKLTTVGNVIDSATGTTGLGKAVDGVIAKTANSALPVSGALTAVNNASTMNDIEKSLDVKTKK